MIVREAELSDAFSIAKVNIDSWRNTYKGIIADEYLNNLNYEKREQAMKNILINSTKDKKYVFVAEDNMDGVIGFVSCGKEREGDKNYKGELYAIYILKSYQNKGIGKLLLNRAMDKLKENNLFPMIIWVLEENLQACNFYEQMNGRRYKEGYISIGNEEYNCVAYSFGFGEKL